MDVQIVEELSRMLAGRKVVTREEVRRRAIRCALKVLGLKLVDAEPDLIDEVADSLIDCPITLKSLHFSDEVKIGDTSFYHPHTVKPEKDDFEEAYFEYRQSKRFLDVFDTMQEVADRFFEGYEAKGRYMRKYSKSGDYYVFFSNIHDAFEDVDIHLKMAGEADGNYVIIVPTEGELDPFLKFFKRYSEDAKRAGLKIWVVNPDAKTVDPFIGYPKDFKLLKGFKNPKAASLVSTYWRVDVRELD
uniref:Uncharacterized protein n=2 Tax=Archaeoglobus fulgidus TaxID=2234 RepID=A0A7C3RI27_ARCFL